MNEAVEDTEQGDPVKRSRRTCSGCRAEANVGDLLRFAVAEVPPFIVPDPRRRLGGRGVSVHPTRKCLELAVERGGFARSLRRPMAVDLETIISRAVQQYEARTMGLLAAGLRSKNIVFGTDATRAALPEAFLVFIARDAASAGRELISAAMVASVPVRTGSTKSELGQLVGRGEVGVMAIQSPQIAREIAEAADRVDALLEERR